MSIQKGLKWWAYREEWGRKEGTGEAEITRVKILNGQAKETDRFNSCSKMRVEVEFVVHEEVEEPHFGVAIFREDGIYGYGPNTLFDGYRIERLHKGKGNFSIEFENLAFGPGAYRISVAIWDKNEVVAYSYHPGFYRFNIEGENQSQELLHLSYQWNSQAKSSSLKPKGLNLTFLKDKWKKKKLSEDIQISAVELLDKEGNLSKSFKTGQKVEIKVKFKKKADWSKHYLWIGLYRRDGVYCHGLWRRLNRDQTQACLVYPKLPLLTGEYLCSVGIWEQDKAVPLVYHHGLYPFKFSSGRRDHGTVYLAHKWKWELP